MMIMNRTHGRRAAVVEVLYWSWQQPAGPARPCSTSVALGQVAWLFGFSPVRERPSHARWHGSAVARVILHLGRVKLPEPTINSLLPLCPPLCPPLWACRRASFPPDSEVRGGGELV